MLKKAIKICLFIGCALSVALLAGSCNKNTNNVTSDTASLISVPAGEKLKIEGVGNYGTYQIISAFDGLSPEVRNFSLADGGIVHMATYTGTAHQQCRITDEGNGYFKIMDDGSGKFMESYLYKGSQRLIQVYERETDAQLWNITSVGNGYFKVINKASNLAVTHADTGILTLKPYINNKTQWWGYKQLANQAYRDDKVVNFFHRVLPSQGSIAFDQGSSIPLSDGRVLWVTEDAFDGSRVTADGNLMCGFFQYHNSILIQPANHDWNPNNTPNMTISTSTANQPRQICNTQPGTDTSWPGVGIEVGNIVYMYNAEISFSASTTKQVIYELTKNAPGNNQWAVKRTLIAGVSDQTDIGWQAGFVKPGDGYVYVYGIKGVFFNANNVYVARFAESDPHTYTFWNGTTWAATPSSANSAVIGSSQSNVAFSYARGKYIMMQTDLGYFCDPNPHSIYLSTSSSPTGPFSKPVKVFSIEDRYRGHLNRFYTPMIHPEFENGKNELLLTYSVNFGSGCEGVGTDNCVNNEQPSINYQVKGVRVPYSLIGL